MIPLRDENPSRTLPVVTRLIIALNVLMFVYEIGLGPSLKPFMMEWGLVPERLTLALRFHLVPLFVFIQIIPLPALLVLGLWFVIQFFSGTLALASTMSGGIAFWAHIGGFAFGALAMLVLGRDRRDSYARVEY